MRYESIKSIILTLLIVASAILTWNLWTFTPSLERSPNKYVDDIVIGEQKDDIRDVIRPSKILFHLDETHFGTTKDSDINMIIDAISSWNYYDISAGRYYSDFKLRQLSNSDGRIEIKYPDLVPFDMYKGIIHLETDNISNAAFDQVVINPTKEKEGSSVYFINTSDSIVYETHVNPERIATLLNQLDKESYDQYIPYELPEDRIVYIPEGEPEIKFPRYFADFIDPDRFRNALFRDPNKVRKGILDNGEQYADDTSKMSVEFETNMIYYANPAQEPGINMEDSENSILKKSFDFINEHGGWTNDYRYAKTANLQRKTEFQLFVKGYPVFSDDGATQIRQYWGYEEIYKYERPYLTLEVEIPPYRTLKLPSAEEALSYLLKDVDAFKPQLLEDLIIGYKLSRAIENQKVVIILEPSWYYLYGGSWIYIDSKDIREGIRNGLEPN